MTGSVDAKRVETLEPGTDSAGHTFVVDSLPGTRRLCGCESLLSSLVLDEFAEPWLI